MCFKKFTIESTRSGKFPFFARLNLNRRSSASNKIVADPPSASFNYETLIAVQFNAPGCLKQPPLISLSAV